MHEPSNWLQTASLFVAYFGVSCFVKNYWTILFFNCTCLELYQLPHAVQMRFLKKAFFPQERKYIITKAFPVKIPVVPIRKKKVSF